MSIRQNFFDSLAKKQPEKTPYSISLTWPAYHKMAEYYGDPNFMDKLSNCLEFVDFEGGKFARDVRENVRCDWFGVEWDKSVDKDIGVVSNQLINEDNIEEFEFPDPLCPELYEGVEEHIKDIRARDRIALGNLGFSLFERAWTLYGMENLLMAMVADEEFAHRLFDRILEFNLKIIEKACTYDIDGMRFGDDWGMQVGLIMGPDNWRKYIKPRVAKMYKCVKDAGKFVMIHSCGQVDSLFPELIELGVDIFNPFQPEVMDIYKVKELYGDKLSFHGGISLQNVMAFGTAEECRAEAEKVVSLIGKNGGLIASPSHSVTGDVPAENIAAVIDVLEPGHSLKKKI